MAWKLKSKDETQAEVPTPTEEIDIEKEKALYEEKIKRAIQQKTKAAEPKESESLTGQELMDMVRGHLARALQLLNSLGA